MFIDFGGMMINTRYILSIYKTKGYKNNFEINIELYPRNNSPIKESYNTVQEANTRFNEIIALVNK